MGPWGYILMGMVMAILNLPFTFAYLPTASLCGFMYSFWWGMLVVSMGSGVGMLCVFLMFRYWMRKSAAKVLVLLVCHVLHGFVLRPCIA